MHVLRFDSFHVQWVLLNNFTIYINKIFDWISDVYTSTMVKSFPYSICLSILYTNRQNIVHKQEKADRYPYSVRYYSPWQFMTSFLFKYGKKYWSNQTSIKIFLLASVGFRPCDRIQVNRASVILKGRRVFVWDIENWSVLGRF